MDRNSITIVRHFVQRGASALVLVALFSPVVCASEKVLHKFHGGDDGAYPDSSLIIDAAGNFYGTTRAGGGGTGCQTGNQGCGTIFKLAPDGGETVLYAFNGGSDGAIPAAGLIGDAAGNFFGTTTLGGSSNDGTVFRLAADDVETVLYAFQGGTDGVGPNGLIEDGAGNLYGTTQGGGGGGSGTVFEVASSGTETVLHSFQGGSDGELPGAGLTRDAAGNLYGTTIFGGAGTGCADGDLGCGVVFKVTPDGSETVLYAFQGGNDGAFPGASLISDSAGTFYGTTESGGPDNHGTVFKLSPNGAETVLYAFGDGSDGNSPMGLIESNGGEFYGITSSGGGQACKGSGCGTVFQLSSNGHEKVLYAFRATHGRDPESTLFLGPQGKLYGTTLEGGAKANEGVAFELKK